MINSQIRLSVIEIVPVTKSQFKPNQKSTRVWFHSDLAELATNPALFKDDCTNNEFSLAIGSESPFPHPSSRNTTVLIPLDLQNLTSGLRHLVKTYGAELRPNGQKYRTVPAKTQEKPRKDWWSGKISIWWYPDYGMIWWYPIIYKWYRW